MSQFRPMLAVPMGAIEDLRYPILVSPKIDGIRCVIRDGVPLSRTLKPIQNKFIFKELSGLSGFDGEITVSDPTALNGFDATQSAVMRFEGEPEFTYHVFDATILTDGCPFDKRLDWASTRAGMYGPRVVALKHHYVRNAAELTKLEERFVAQGYEGLMIRDPNGPYKSGRSTLKEGYLLKMIRRHRAEVVITGFVEKMHNANEAETSELGRTKRSKKKAGMVPAGTLGALKCVWLVKNEHDAPFEIGTGFDDATKQLIWDNRDTWLNKVGVVEYREITKDGAPRFPAWKGRRHADDMDGAPPLGEPIVVQPQAHRRSA